ncbi:MAG TPA: hypothetical protein VEK56_06495 [Vicinamibacterales bacterium]|nr:hypothetical protein [Vicinamibacterales bacterium]
MRRSQTGRFSRRIPAALWGTADRERRLPAPNHHYTWELFALDTKLDLTPEAARADVLKAMDGHILGKAVLVGRFKRPQ